MLDGGEIGAEKVLFSVLMAHQAATFTDGVIIAEWWELLIYCKKHRQTHATELINCGMNLSNIHMR